MEKSLVIKRGKITPKKFLMKEYLIKRLVAYCIDVSAFSIGLRIFSFACNIYTEHPSYIILMSPPLSIFYFIFSDFIFGRTLGKKFMKLRIDGFESTNKIKLLMQVTIRNIFRLMPLDQISIFFYDDNRMWHDRVSKTQVEDCG